MVHRARWVLALIAWSLIILGVPASAFGQNGRITGVVEDVQGAPVAGVTVVATNLATNAARSAISEADGRYTIAELPAGTYGVTTVLAGFRGAVSEVRVTAGGTASADLVLQPVRVADLTVTAMLREQELFDVPFSIAAPTASVLRSRGAGDLESVAANVAGFTVQNLGPGQSQPAMRGASAGQIARDQPGVKEEVGIYLDDVPVSLSLFTPDLDLFDLSRVEVLRGPQGTLFGSGSLAGTVRYITNQPELGVSRVFGETSGGLIDGGGPGGTLKLGVNQPIGDRAAVRIAGYRSQFGGYMDAVRPDMSVDDDVNRGDRTGIRAAVLFQPTGRLRVTPRVTYQRVEMDGWNRIDGYNILANPYTTSRPPVTIGERQLFLASDEPYTDDFLLGDLKLEYDFGGAELTSITSYTDRDIVVTRDGGALYASIVGGTLGLPEPVYTLSVPFDDVTSSTVFTQELRLTGETGRVRWLVGGFYSDHTREYGQSVLVPGFSDITGIPTEGLRASRDELFFSDLSYDLKQFGLFGEGTLSVTDRLGLTAGLRFYRFDEDREQVFDGIFTNDDTGTAVVSVPGSTDADGIAPRLIASYDASDDLTVNAQVSKGFRLGGINDPLNTPVCTPEDLATFSGRESWTDETVWNYEVGMKSRLLDGRASLNVSAYYMDINDLQLIVTAGSCSSRLVFNVPDARSRGLEAEFAMTPDEHFDFAVSASLNDAELGSTLTSTSEEGDVRVVAGIEEGNRLPSVPNFQAAAAATYSWALTSDLGAFVTGSWQHVGSRITQIDDHAEGFGTVDLEAHEAATIGAPLTQTTFAFDPELPAYDLFNLRVGVVRGRWEVALFGSNLTDERAFLALDRERGTLARVGYLTNRPRTIGLELRLGH